MEELFPFMQEQNIIYQPVHILQDMGTEEDGLAQIL